MKMLVMSKKDITEEQIVAVNKEANNVPNYHSLETHNWYADQKMLCPYCNLGSKPVPKALLKELIK